MNNIQKFYKNEYNRDSSFQRIFGLDHLSLENTGWNNKFHIRLLKFLKDNDIIDSLDVDLKYLHNLIDQKYLKFNLLSNKENNNSRPIISDKLFDFSIAQKDLYHDFLKWLYQDIIKEDFYFQKTPTVRVHMPDIRILSLPAWHSDCFFGHSPRDINVWFGLTDNKKSDFWVKKHNNSLKWFEEVNYDIDKWSEICFSKDESFNNVGFNEAFEVDNIFNSVFLFDGRCIHTASYRSSEDETTRLSIDVRILLIKDYEWKVIDNKPVFKGRGIKGAEFRPGHPYGFCEKSIANMIGENNER
jgi:hypothetical protein